MCKHYGKIYYTLFIFISKAPVDIDFFQMFAITLLTQLAMNLDSATFNQLLLQAIQILLRQKEYYWRLEMDFIQGKVFTRIIVHMFQPLNVTTSYFIVN